jgi:hypothetical protein
MVPAFPLWNETQIKLTHYPFGLDFATGLESFRERTETIQAGFALVVMSALPVLILINNKRGSYETRTG